MRNKNETDRRQFEMRNTAGLMLLFFLRVRARARAAVRVIVGIRLRVRAGVRASMYKTF